MKLESSPGTLVLQLLALAALTDPVSGQNACLRSSVPDAEVGWTAYMAEDRGGLLGAGPRQTRARCDEKGHRRAAVRHSGDPISWPAGGLERRSVARPAGPARSRETTVQSDPADEAWREGDTELALELYEDRLARNPNDDVALHRVALMRAWAREYDVADELFGRLLELEPDNLDARVDRDRVWAWAGETDRALADLADLLEAHPGHEGALEARALFEAWAGRYDESLSSYEQLLAIWPNSGEARRQQAQVLSWASRFEASRAVYDSLLARDPSDVESRLGLATALAFSNELDDAIAEYDRILSTDPENVTALRGKGRALGWANRLVEGEEVFRSAVAADQANAASLVGLAQILRWQNRNGAALEVLRRAEEIAPTDVDVRGQLRAVALVLNPVARPSVVWENDSDGNRMLTSNLTIGWHPRPRLELRADAYRRDLEQSSLHRSAMGVMIAASYELEPGWTLSAGGGGSESDGIGEPSFTAYRVALASPPRHPATVTVTFASGALDETAVLANVGVKTTGAVVSGRWTPASGWRVDVAAGRTRFRGTQSNDRTHGLLSVSSRVGRHFSLGGTVRTFAFEQDLTDGYFDPDFYGIGELNGAWRYDPARWSLLLEVAPGLQQVTSSGGVGATLRGSARIAYRFAPGRELSLSGGYSSAGLQSFSSGASDYRYEALIFGMSWVF